MLFYLADSGYSNFGFPIPALGKLINPFNGLWLNSERLEKMDDVVDTDALEAAVDVHFDDRNVPHIFATNDYDLYYTQGYMHAKDRLWQMDFTTRVASGRLSEVVGSKALEFDRFHRRIGIKRAAMSSLDSLRTLPEYYNILQAYSDGVNARIEELKFKDYPIEFKLMNYKPEDWTPLKSILIVKYMAWDLDGFPDDLYYTNSKKILSDSLFQELYPEYDPYTVPIVPEEFYPKAARAATETHPVSNEVYAGSPNKEKYRKGSNNWVVHGSRTKSGHPILADDPHLGLSLPSIWYENQLTTPDVNVYGVTIPGVPMVVIGYNENIAWGLTYITSDVIDYYALKLDESGKKYMIDGEWKPLTITLNTIKVKDAFTNTVDTVYHSEFGPVVNYNNSEYWTYRSIPPKSSMRWTAHDKSLDMITFYELNKARNYNDYVNALKHFNAPGQNFVFASKTGDIAIYHNGHIPLRTSNESAYVKDGTKSADIKKMVPFELLPNAKNPAQGFLQSGNQSPVSPRYPYWLGNDYVSYERSGRIAEVLSKSNGITVEDMQQLQHDAKGILAEKLLPMLLKDLNKEKLKQDALDALTELENWDYYYSADSKAPVLFEAWRGALLSLLYRDEFGSSDLAWAWPRNSTMLHDLETKTDAAFYDDKFTDNVVEDRPQLIQQAFDSAMVKLSSTIGGLNDSWEWGKYNATNIGHLADLGPFSRNNIYTDGYFRTVNATNGSHGPSWRMIVEMGPEVKGYGVYPGGQTGNPAAEGYDAFIDDWNSGYYYELVFMKDENDTGSIKRKITFTPNDN